MKRALNVLGSLALLLFLILGRGLTRIIEGERKLDARERARFRFLLALWFVATASFAVLGLYVLVHDGYLPVALLLAVVVGSFVRGIVRRRPSRTQ